MDSYLFTSESVSEGHPDKVADQISDAILDAILAQDPYSRVAAETLCNTGLVVLAGEITTQANVDYIDIARETLKRIGYDNSEYGIDHKGCSVLVGYDKQSNDIAQGVDRASDDYLEQGAGDQGLMFGYACDETPEKMPLPISLAHALCRQLTRVRKDGTLPYLRPDGKSQVTVEYEGDKPVGVDTVVMPLNECVMSFLVYYLVGYWLRMKLPEECEGYLLQAEGYLSKVFSLLHRRERGVKRGYRLY